MKKIITIIIVAVLAAAGYFGYDYTMDKKMTNPSEWSQTGNSEFTVNLPEDMKSGSNLWHTSDGQEQIAYYYNSKAGFSVAKLPYSVNGNLKNIDIKSYLENITINNVKLDIKPVNNGYYYSTVKKSSGTFKNTDKVFTIESIFKGDDAVYSVAIQCRESDRNNYEASMLEWLKSFELK
ncbi:MAG: hypothetical protein K2J40_01870 [Ruminococcus sp.]|nr:hypothetical protein [Ruminococcus sp.]